MISHEMLYIQYVHGDNIQLQGFVKMGIIIYKKIIQYLHLFNNMG